MVQTLSTWAEFMTIFLCICTYVKVEAGFQFLYMTNYCSMVVSIDDSLLLDLTPPDKLVEGRSGDFLHCDLEIIAPRDTRILVHVQRLGISPVSEHSDRLQLYEGNPTHTRLTPMKGLFGRLDTSLSISDISGSKVKDYKTSSNKLKVDYLGKPTRRTPGFRLIITAFQDATSAGNCPPTYYHCRRASVCIMHHVVCDGHPNCGKDDDDESECHSDDTVTDLLAGYSLTRDIIVVILLPVVTFLAAVTAIYLTARHYVTHRIELPELSSVHFTAQKDGHVKIADKTRIYNPPTYQDIMDMGDGYEPPPTYNQLAGSVARCDRSTGIRNGKYVLRTDESKLQRECELCSCVMHDCGLPGIPEEVNYCHSDGYTVHSVPVSDTDEYQQLATSLRENRGKGRAKKRIKDENVCFIYETKQENIREESENSLMTSCVVCCYADQCQSTDVNDASPDSHVSSNCMCNMTYSNPTQPHEEYYSHCLNHTQPQEKPYSHCLNPTQPHKEDYSYCLNPTQPHEENDNRYLNPAQPHEESYTNLKQSAFTPE